MIVVGVAGGTASGKTTIAAALVAELGEQAVTIAHDRYYKPLPDAFRATRVAYNFDHPDALDTGRLVADLQALKRGERVTLVDYNFVDCTRKPASEWTPLDPVPVVVVEGILVFAVPELVAEFDHRVFVHTPADLRLARRLRRDIAERGDTPIGVLDQYVATVRPMHEAFVEPSRRHAELQVDGTDPTADAVRAIRSHLGLAG